MEELITIVIPVYNVEKYLENCLKSIINQTYKNLEIILVDDGSRDNSGKMCDDYQKKDERIKVIHKQNGGLSDARNAGIDIATGEYISFVDSDDAVTLDYIEYMYNMIKKDNSQMAISETKRLYNEDEEIEIKEEYEHIVMDSKQTLYEMLFARRGDVSAYSKLYKTYLFNEIRYPKGKVYEDSATTYKLIEKCDKISYGNKQCYYYYTRIGSISKQGKFNKNEYDYIEHTNQMLSYIENKYPEIQIAVDRYYVYSKFRILRMLIYTKPRDKEFEKRVIQDIKKKQKNVLKAKETPKRDKIAIISLKFGLGTFKILWYLYTKMTGRRE